MLGDIPISNALVRILLVYVSMIQCNLTRPIVELMVFAVQRFQDHHRAHEQAVDTSDVSL